MTGKERHNASTAEPSPGWLDDPEWRRVQATIPIACVDVLPTKADAADGCASSIGLIRRETPLWGTKWCLIGGRLLRNESLTEAVARQLRETLGDDVRFDLDADAQPTYVSQYFTEAKEGGGLDPRQHAIGLIFVIPISGHARPQGEAIEFAWFDRCNLPRRDEFGFEQHRIVTACLDRFPEHNEVLDKIRDLGK